jgi:poly(3-hydroxybutyrate) depolymerase
MCNILLKSKILVAVAIAALFAVNAASGAERLPPYGANLSETSVSGLSSGAAMALQFHVAHSGIVKGAGIIAGVPYDCAEQSTNQATNNCMKPDAGHPVPDPAHLTNITDSLARSGAIDDVANLNDARVWLFSGRKDEVVHPVVMDAARDYYAFYVPPDRIVYRNDIGAGHAMVTEDYGDTQCGVNKAPFIVDCDFDAAKALLEQIYGPLNPPSAQPAGKYVEFDQKEFLPDGNPYNHSLSDVGYAYVPHVCALETCRVHVALHGCKQQAAEVGDAFYKNAGYNRWADTNHIIVVYPQTISRWGWGWPFYTLNFVLNPNACWDWWGYDNAEHHTKKGPQIAAIRAIVDRLATKP